MKIGVIIPTEEQKGQAGVRIRYDRIKPALQALGHELELIPIQGMASTVQPNNDIYLISKCYDARAILVAQHLRRNGKQVGVDLFDDYFSQQSDSRFVRLRYWLRSLLPHCAFILCSTHSMQNAVKTYAAHLPVHVMNDPALPFDSQKLAANLSRKFAKAQQNRQIDIAWFGMGDNPNFSVGLSDLAIFGSEIDRLRGHGYKVHLSILTNQRAMTADNLALIAKLATPYTIKEWSVDQEAALLSSSLISFLPVNAQNFSRVKSLNRAITALTSGTQVLSAGYPLYHSLRSFIYRTSSQLIADLNRGELALRDETLEAFREVINQVADVDTEARSLINFLNAISEIAPESDTNAIFAVIHGKETIGDIHKFAQKINVLSVASPLCKIDINFDVRFQCNERGSLVVLINRKRSSLIDEKVFKKNGKTSNIAQSEFIEIDVLKAFPEILLPGEALLRINTAAAVTAVYPRLMSCVTEVLKKIFPGIAWVFSEQSKRIPWVTVQNVSALKGLQ